jgi:hypothetical protein
MPTKYRRRAAAGALLAILGLLLWPWVAGATAPSAPDSAAAPAPPSRAAAPAPPVSPTATVCPLYFIDVPGSNPFYAPIIYLACQGVVSGYQDATFRPNGTITRGQISKMEVLAAGISDVIPSDQQTFADVPPSQPFWLFIEVLAGRGYVSGYTCGGAGEPCVPPGNRPYFRPYGNATRGQAAKIVANTFFPNCVTPARRR